MQLWIIIGCGVMALLLSRPSYGCAEDLARKSVEELAHGFADATVDLGHAMAPADRRSWEAAYVETVRVFTTPKHRLQQKANDVFLAMPGRMLVGIGRQASTLFKRRLASGGDPFKRIYVIGHANATEQTRLAQIIADQEAGLTSANAGRVVLGNPQKPITEEAIFWETTQFCHSIDGKCPIVLDSGEFHFFAPKLETLKNTVRSVLSATLKAGIRRQVSAFVYTGRTQIGKKTLSRFFGALPENNSGALPCAVQNFLDDIRPKMQNPDFQFQVHQHPESAETSYKIVATDPGAQTTVTFFLIPQMDNDLPHEWFF